MNYIGSKVLESENLILKPTKEENLKEEYTKSESTIEYLNLYDNKKIKQIRKLLEVKD